MLARLQQLAGIPLVALTAVAKADMDEDRLTEVAAKWRQLARGLDGSVELLGGMPAASNRGWIADDQREFARVTGDMHVSTEALRDTFDKLAEILEGVINAFRLFKGAMMALTVLLIPLLAYVAMMKSYPATAVQTRLYVRWLANAVDKVVAVTVGALITYVTGQMVVLGCLMAKEQQFDKLAYPSALGGKDGARLPDVDFAHLKIDALANPTFQTPDPGEKLPDRTKDFKWVAPQRATDEADGADGADGRS
ncbi:hypothetical protein [Nonomuraea sp. NPDC005650]|uniref:hypothetical protein n=1 Tax=Nonomuraea sp. NPDC005650 TaxID=3157045 RepID=UPI0033B14C96